MQGSSAMGLDFNVGVSSLGLEVSVTCHTASQQLPEARALSCTVLQSSSSPSTGTCWAPCSRYSIWFLTCFSPFVLTLAPSSTSSMSPSLWLPGT